MHLIIKLPNQNLDIELDQEASVEKLRNECAVKLNSAPDDICLVFKGKIMRDKDSLKNLDVIDGCSIHCALKKPSNAQPKITESKNITQPPVSQITNTQTQTSNNFSLPNFSNLNINPLSQSNTGDLNDFSRFIAESNIFENMQNLSPQHKKFFESYPELLHSLKDPAVVKQIVEAFKNPNVLKDLMANQDAMLNQLQNIPGGLNQYMNFMKEVNSLNQPQEKPPPVTGPVPTDGSSVNISGEAMPNPWGNNNTAPTSNNRERNKYVIEDEDNPLFRDAIRALKLMDMPENDLARNFMGSIRKAIQKLTPRGIYGLTEFVKGLEVIKEESPELVALMLNYQISTLRVPDSVESLTSNTQASNEIPPENGNEETYRQQLTELDTMGFNNKEENIEALRHSYGDVAAAVDWILRRRGIL